MIGAGGSSPAQGMTPVVSAGLLLWLAVAGLVAALVPAGIAPPPLFQGLVLVIVAPWAEELIFRWGLQDSLLRRWPTHGWSANVTTALAFGLAHALIRHDAAALVVAVPALGMGLLYGRWRLVWPCVALHAAMNALWLLGLRDLLPSWIGA